MTKVANFEKVSFKEFTDAMRKMLTPVDAQKLDLQKMYDDIKLPIRSTEFSGGYDFFIPFNAVLQTDSALLIPTGIRCKFEQKDFTLDIVPRSGLGFKHGVYLANTIGIIDSDYYDSENEGHIMVKLEMPSDRVPNPMVSVDTSNDYEYILAGLSFPKDENLKLNKGDRFVQGIFHQYGITTDDQATGKRSGGFGSTGK